MLRSISGSIFTYIGHFIHDNRDEITAASTAIIAIFTALLGIFTIGIFTIRLSRSIGLPPMPQRALS
jgi:hypothetical protein